jgi:hypothetical protein
VNFEFNSTVRYLSCESTVLIHRRYDQIDDACFHSHSDISTVDFEEGSRVSFFGPDAFALCSGLAAFRIPSTSETIGMACFMFCSKLRTVTFESVSRVAVIGEDAFAYCELQSNARPSRVGTIGPSCFRECHRLAAGTVENGNPVSVIGKGAFSGCPSSLQLPKPLIWSEPWPPSFLTLRAADSALGH